MKYIALVPFAALTLTALADDAAWPQFRGPTGQGIAVSTNLPLTWSETNNVRWKTPLPGKGYSSPIIAEGKIYLTAAGDDNLSRHLLTLDLDSGKLLSDQTIYAFPSNQLEIIHGMNSGATPTPVYEDGRLYVTFGHHGSFCYDTRANKKLWERTDLYVDYYDVGPASSQIIYKDKLIWNCDGAATNTQYVIALDKLTGKTIWQTQRVYISNTVPQYAHASSVPLVINVEGKDILISPGSQGVRAYDPDTGKELWKAIYDGWSTVPRPIYADGKLFIASGVTAPRMMVIHPTLALQGDITQTSAVLWTASKDVPDMPSANFYKGELYILTKNALFRRNADTGEVLDSIKPVGQFLSSPVLADGKLYIFARGKQSYVVGAESGLPILAKNTLDTGCMATPAVYKDALIVRTSEALYRLENLQ